jgi:hypothetical protein
MKEYKYSEAVTVCLGKVDFNPRAFQMCEIASCRDLENPSPKAEEQGTPGT